MFATLFASKWFYFGLLGLGVIGAVWFGIHEYGAAQAAAAKATAQCYAETSRSNAQVIAKLKATYEQEILALKAAADREQTAMGALSKKVVTTEQRYARIRAALMDVLAKYPTAREWYDTPIPQSVRTIIEEQVCLSSPTDQPCLTGGKP